MSAAIPTQRRRDAESDIWPRVRLGEVCKQIRGVSYKPIDASATLENGYVPLLRANNISDGIINHDELVYVKRERVLQSQFLQQGDILVCTSSGSLKLVGKAAQVLSAADESFGAFCRVLRSNSTISTAYFGHYFQSATYRKTISGKAAGANINNIRNEDLDELQIPLPPLAIQRRIAAKLDRLCDIVAKRKNQLSQLNQLVKSRFVEMFGDEKRFPSVTVGDVFTVKGPKRIHKEEWTSEGVPFYRVSNFSDLLEGRETTSDNFISRSRFEELKSDEQVPVAGDVLVTARGTLGRCYVVEPHDEFYFQDGMITWLADRSERITLPYFLQAVQSQTFKRQYEGKSSGTTVAYMTIGQLAKYRLPLPPLALQREFAAFVEKVDKLAFAARQRRDVAKQLYRAKIQEFFG